MLNKKVMVLAIFFISLVAVSCVSAAEDAGDVAAIENDTQTDVITIDTATDEIQGDALKASADDESDYVPAASNDGEILTDASEVYVDSGYTGTGHGTLAEPYNNLKEALDSGRKDGDIIRIVAGVYTGENNIGLEIRNNLSFTNWELGEVVFDAQGNGNIFNVVAREINITGITFKNAVNEETQEGGALYFENGLINSQIGGAFINNSAYLGGAIFVNGNIEDSLISAYFADNSALTGGAIYAESITHTEIDGDFKNNTAISDFEFVGDDMEFGHGGAIYAETIEDSLIDGDFILNRAGNSGGAIYVSEGMYRTNVTASFRNNFALVGGAVNAPAIRNSKISAVFVNNTALAGGAINANIINNTEIELYFINNTADVDLELIEEGIIEESLAYLEENEGYQDIMDYIWDLVENYDLYSGFGGAIAVVGILENSNITGEFENNEGADAGGAICVIGIVNNALISGYYEYNRAKLGGSLFLPVVKNSNITGGYMNNHAVQGGAIFAEVFNVTTINADFSSNYAVPGDDDLLACGGAICIDGAAVFSTIGGTFMSNNATFGAAIGCLDFIAFSNIAGYFIDNHAIFGGAIDVVLLKYSNIAGYFVNNTAGIGGAICAMDIDTVEMQAHFVNNSAFSLEEIEQYLPESDAEYISEYMGSMDLDKSGFGGAVAVAGLLKNSEFRGDFILNSATVGGAIFAVSLSINGHELDPIENNIFRSNFIGNGAGIGAAIYINSTSLKNKIDSNFIDNVAERDGIIYICESSEDTISNCLFTNNTAANSLISVNSSAGTNITYNIFLNSARVYDIAVNGEAKLFADNNWFGHNSSDYMDSPKVKGIGCNNWLFLDGAADPASVSYLGSSNVVFNLFVYDNSTKSVKGKFDHTLLEPVNLTVASTNGKIDKKNITFGDVIKFSSNGKKGTVTAAIANAQDTVEIKCLPRLTGNNLVMDYLGDNYKIQVFDTNGDPATGEVVKMTVNGVTYSIKSDKNGYATLPIILKPKTYTITSKYKGFVLKNTIKVKSTLKSKKTFSVKKSAKKLVLKATLKWSSGKAITGKKVSFKFNGKKFAVKTNKEGLAKITLSVKIISKGKAKLTFKNKAVKLNVGKKYKMIVSYRNETVSSSVTVKK